MASGISLFTIHRTDRQGLTDDNPNGDVRANALVVVGLPIALVLLTAIGSYVGGSLLERQRLENSMAIERLKAELNRAQSNPQPAPAASTPQASTR